MKKLSVAFLLVLLLAPVPALAIPPPDFIFNIFSQIGQILAISLVVASSVVGFCFQYLRGWWSSLKFKKSLVFLIVAGALSIGYGVSYSLESRKAAAEFEAWQKQEVLKRQQQAEMVEAELRKKNHRARREASGGRAGSRRNSASI